MNNRYSLSRRNFSISAGLTAISGMTLPLAFGANAAADKQTRAVENATVVSIRSPKGATHTLVTHNDGNVTIQLLEGPDGIVIVDSGDAVEYAESALSVAQAIGKPVTAVFLSHDHPDHTGGLVAYKSLPIFTTSGILNNIKSGPFPKPDNIDDVTSLDDAEVIFAGLELTVHTYRDAEALEQIVIEAPLLGTAVVQDLVYNNCYPFPGMDRNGWLNVLSQLKNTLNVEQLLVGHGYPTSRGALSGVIDYMSEYQQMISESSSGEELAEKLEQRWPNHLGRGLLKLQGFAFRG